MKYFRHRFSGGRHSSGEEEREGEAKDARQVRKNLSLEPGGKTHKTRPEPKTYHKKSPKQRERLIKKQARN